MAKHDQIDLVHFPKKNVGIKETPVKQKDFKN